MIRWIGTVVLLWYARPLVAQNRVVVRIEVQRNVDVRKSERLSDSTAHQLRGVLYADTAFQLRKGQQFTMSATLAEGSCRVRIVAREIHVSSCPWLPGFRDHQADIFKVITQSAGK